MYSVFLLMQRGEWSSSEPHQPSSSSSSLLHFLRVTPPPQPHLSLTRHWHSNLQSQPPWLLHCADGTHVDKLNNHIQYAAIKTKKLRLYPHILSLQSLSLSISLFLFISFSCSVLPFPRYKMLRARARQIHALFPFLKMHLFSYIFTAPPHPPTHTHTHTHTHTQTLTHTHTNTHALPAPITTTEIWAAVKCKWFKDTMGCL